MTNPLDMHDNDLIEFASARYELENCDRSTLLGIAHRLASRQRVGFSGHTSLFVEVRDHTVETLMKLWRDASLMRIESVGALVERESRIRIDLRVRS